MSPSTVPAPSSRPAAQRSPGLAGSPRSPGLAVLTPRVVDPRALEHRALEQTGRPVPAARRRPAEPDPETVETPLTRAAREPDVRPTGRGPGLVGLLLGVLAVAGAIVPVALPRLVLPVMGPIADSGLVLAGLVLLAVTALACSGLGVGPARRGRAVAVAGLTLGGVAVLMTLGPVLALAAV